MKEKLMDNWCTVLYVVQMYMMLLFNIFVYAYQKKKPCQYGCEGDCVKEEDVVETNESSYRSMKYRASPFDKLSKEINSVVEDGEDYIFDQELWTEELLRMTTSITMTIVQPP